MSDLFSLRFFCNRFVIKKFYDIHYKKLVTVKGLRLMNFDTGESFETNDEYLITAYCACRSNFLNKNAFEELDELFVGCFKQDVRLMEHF